MKLTRIKFKRVIAILLFLGVLFLFISGSYAADSTKSSINEDSMEAVEPDMNNNTETRAVSESDQGIIIDIIGDETKQLDVSGGELSTTYQYVRIKLLNGERKAELVEARYARNLGYGSQYQTPLLKTGNKVIVSFTSDEEGNNIVEVVDVIRENYLLWLVIGFFLLLIIIGGVKGLKAVLTLLITVCVIFFILIPTILKGADPVLSAIAICTMITLMAILIINGVNKKAFAAIIGTTGGVVAAGILAKLVGVAAQLTGLGDEEAQMLMYLPTEVHFDFQGLLFAGIIIGALGAAMDVAVSLSSAMFELKEHNPTLPGTGLLRSGMNIGRDMMATMSNTLILAYTGGTLPLLMLLVSFKMPFIDIINKDLIASEIVRALAGSIGLILTIPITAVSVILMTDTKKEKVSVPDEFKV